MQVDDWLPGPNTIDPKPHQVDVWRVSLDFLSIPVQWAQSTLSADEAQRALRFRFEEDRQRFIIAHACLREVLSRYLGCEPKQINFSTNENGKPELSPHNNLDFNLSHSGGYVLIAVACERKVGVDVEHFRPGNLDHDKIARRYFSQSEVSELTALPPRLQMEGFYNCWTRKEAYIKALGVGLSLPLDSFDVSLTPDEPAVLREARPDPNEASRWTLISLDIQPDYACAVAVEGRELDFRLFSY